MLMRLLITLLILAFASPAWADTITVEVLDIGQGDAILIRNQDAGKTVLIDGGVRKHMARDILKRKGITAIDLAVATHAHADHIGGMESILRSMTRVGLYVDNGQVHTTATYNNLMKAIEELNIRYRPAKAGQVYKIGDARLEVLWPGETLLSGTRSDLNSNSVIIRLVNGDDCMLFTGDAEEPTEHGVVAGGLTSCAVLKVAHHGSDHSSTASFLDTLKPQHALISCGKNNRYGHPGEETMARLTERGIKVYRTDTQGELVVTLTGSGVRIDTRTAGSETSADVASTDPSKAAPDGAVNVNAASVDELTALHGIGPSKAKAIVADRDTNGPFKSCDDLVRVKGIGPKTVAKISAQCVTQ